MSGSFECFGNVYILERCLVEWEDNFEDEDYCDGCVSCGWVVGVGGWFGVCVSDDSEIEWVEDDRVDE